MEFNFFDFLIGMFAANAIPHLIFGLMKIRFFSLFGFHSNGNLIYSGLNFVFSLGIYEYRYGLGTLFHQSILLGVLYLYFAFIVVGRSLYLRWNKNR